MSCFLRRCLPKESKATSDGPFQKTDKKCIAGTLECAVFTKSVVCRVLNCEKFNELIVDFTGAVNCFV